MSNNDSKLRTALCAVCNKAGDTSSLKMCGGCHATYYCSSGCQRLDWPHHKSICKKTRTDQPFDDSVLLDDVIPKIMAHYDKWRAITHPLWQSFSQAMLYSGTTQRILSHVLNVELEYQAHGSRSANRFRIISHELLPHKQIAVRYTEFDFPIVLDDQRLETIFHIRNVGFLRLYLVTIPN